MCADPDEGAGELLGTLHARLIRQESYVEVDRDRVPVAAAGRPREPQHSVIDVHPQAQRLPCRHGDTRVVDRKARR